MRTSAVFQGVLLVPAMQESDGRFPAGNASARLPWKSPDE